MDLPVLLFSSPVGFLAAAMGFQFKVITVMRQKLSGLPFVSEEKGDPLCFHVGDLFRDRYFFLLHKSTGSAEAVSEQIR